MENKDLQWEYNRMHAIGKKAWFGDGEEERGLILKMGEPWAGSILEIGCGEGDLAARIGGNIQAIDYSKAAIAKAREKHPHIQFVCDDYHLTKFVDVGLKYNRLVMQGVLEHLDDPFKELKWMMDNLLGEKGDVITSSPCFLNPRGLVWMTLDMLGAVMSKTDLHFLNPWDFKRFCHEHNYGLEIDYCDRDWGNGEQMMKDLSKRIPLALRDGNIHCSDDKLGKFLDWLDRYPRFPAFGATAAYRISK